jgi:hypothetical protein
MNAIEAYLTQRPRLLIALVAAQIAAFALYLVWQQRPWLGAGMAVAGIAVTFASIRAARKTRHLRSKEKSDER